MVVPSQKCICQICTCGRHRCPPNRNCSSALQSSKEGKNLSAESSVYRNEFAFKRHDKSCPIRPKANIEIDKDGKLYEKCSLSQDAYRAYDTDEAKDSRQNWSKKEDNLRLQSGKMETLTTHKKEYIKHNVSRPKRINRSKSDMSEQDSLHKKDANEVEVSTNAGSVEVLNESEYRRIFKHPPLIDRVEPIRPKAQYDWIVADYDTQDSTPMMTMSPPDLQISNQWYDRSAENKSSPASVQPSPIISDTTARPSNDQFQLSNQYPLSDSLDIFSSPMIKDSKSDVISAETSARRTEMTKQDEYAARKVDKVLPIRPTDSFIPPSGAFASSTTSREHFRESKGDRHPMKKPIDNINRIDAKMDDKTVHQDDYRQVKIDRPKAVKPVHQLTLPNEPMQLSTTNDEIYIEGKGDRMPMIKPSDNIKVDKVGKISDVTAQKESYTKAAGGERVKQVKPVNLYQPPTGKLDASTVHRETYVEGKGDRMPVIKPKDQIQKEGGSMEKTTVQKDSYAYVRNERVQPVKPENSYSPPSGVFDDKTVNKETYVLKTKGDRMPVIKPTDHIEKYDVPMKIETTHKSEFVKSKSERVKPVRPKNEYLPPKGKFSDITVNKAAYVPVIGDRMPIKKHIDNIQISTASTANATAQRESYKRIDEFEKVRPIKPHDLYQPPMGKFDSKTTNSTSFFGGKGARMPMIKPKDNIGLSDKTEFDTITTNMNEYKNIKTERVKPIIHKDSHESATGDISATTVHKETFTEKQTERMPIKKPLDNIQLEKGAIDLHTTQQDHFRQSANEGFVRPTPVKPENQLSKAEGELDTMTVYKEAFREGKAERMPVVKPKDTIPKQIGDLDLNTVHRTTFTEMRGERLPIKIPQNNLKIGAGQFSGTTVHQEQFQAFPYKKPDRFVRHGDRIATAATADKNKLQGAEFAENARIENTDILSATGTEAYKQDGVGEGPTLAQPFDAIHDNESRVFRGSPSRRGSSTNNKHSKTTHRETHSSVERPSIEVPSQNLYNVIPKGDLDFKTAYQQHYPGVQDFSGRRLHLENKAKNQQDSVKLMENLPKIESTNDNKPLKENALPTSSSSHDSLSASSSQFRNSARVHPNRNYSSLGSVGNQASPSSVYADTFRLMDFGSVIRPSPVRPRSQIEIRHLGPLYIDTNYSSQYTPKSVEPCIAGRLLNSVQNRWTDIAGAVDKEYSFSHAQEGHQFFKPFRHQ